MNGDMRSLFVRVADVLDPPSHPAGALLWSVGDTRAYERQDGDTYVLTLVSESRGTRRYEVVGVDGSCYR